MMRKEAAGELPSQPAPVQWGGDILFSGVACRLFYQRLGDVLVQGGELIPVRNRSRQAICPRQEKFWPSAFGGLAKRWRLGDSW